MLTILFLTFVCYHRQLQRILMSNWNITSRNFTDRRKFSENLLRKNICQQLRYNTIHKRAIPQVKMIYFILWSTQVSFEKKTIIGSNLKRTSCEIGAHIIKKIWKKNVFNVSLTIICVFFRRCRKSTVSQLADQARGDTLPTTNEWEHGNSISK